MGALPKKKTPVVAIDSARRRRRQPSGPEKPKPPKANTVAFALAVIVAAAATIFGLKIVMEFVRQGNYVAAAVAPFWVIAPGCAPLLYLILKHRRAAGTAPMKVARISDNGRRGGMPPRGHDR
jgi:hypothetical protein